MNECHRKRVLLYCQDEDRRKEFSFLLTTRGYGVLSGISALPPLPDLVLIIDDGTLATMVAAKSIGDCLPQISMLVVLKQSWKPVPSNYPAHAEKLRAGLSSMQILERIKVLARRKRGPKRQLVMA